MIKRFEFRAGVKCSKSLYTSIVVEKLPEILSDVELPVEQADKHVMQLSVRFRKANDILNFEMAHDAVFDCCKS